MTGLVVVSHSRALADAAVDLASEMLHHREVRIEVAAGIDESTFGTDATAIAAAVTAADDGTGVVVLMDLGSAVISAEVALDLIEPEVRERTVLCPAPLVEGLAVAAVAAAGGAAPAEVAAEAVGALAAKQAHLGEAQHSVEHVSAHADATAEVTITNRHGLHARPAALLVQRLRTYDAEVLLRNLDSGTGPVPARSLSRVATLGALQGHRVEVTASGPQAREAVAALVELAGREFDEAAEPVTSPGPATAGPLPASPGVAVGPVVRLEVPAVEPPYEPSADPQEMWRRLQEAIDRVREDVRETRRRAAREVGESEARIFDAHLALLDDVDLLADVRRRTDDGESAARAWHGGVGAVAESWEELSDDYLRARAADVRGVGQQVLRVLLGAPAPTIVGHGILVADDLTPAEVSALDPHVIRGLVLAGGSPTGHAAILARARGIPAVVAAGSAVLALADGTTVAIDGVAGELLVDPPPDVVRRLEQRRTEDQARAAAALAAASAPATTVDGVTVEVAANVGSTSDARTAAEHGADLAGLVRTEFLYLDRTQPPTVAEQVETYLSLATALGGRRLTLRTLDAGGDKPLPYVRRPVEANPFLGVRGLRLALAEPQLFRDQLEAIVTVARQTPVSLMFPMVSTVEELTSARAVLDSALAGERPEGFRVGMMVEVPAAALKVAVLAGYVDFWSIGTNDLTQYTLAAERGNPAVAAVGDALDPAVLRLIEFVCRHASGRPVAVCGELAADPAAVPLLLALGVRELSVAPAAVPAVKEAVRRSVAADPGLVARALDAAGPAEVRALLRSWIRAPRIG